MDSQKLAKKSHERLIISGNHLEHFVYSRPYFWNLNPVQKNASSWGQNTERRTDNLNKTRNYLTRLIWANESKWGERPKFITFTFAENVTEVSEANFMWRQFSRKMLKRFGRLKYVAVTEFQKRGAVHYHVLYFNLKYTKNLKNILSDLWGQGFVKVKATGRIDNVGLYVSKYLTKEHADCRLVTKKAYFTSRGLSKPDQYKEENNISTVYNLHDPFMVLQSSQTYRSNYHGSVKKNHYVRIIKRAG